MGGKIFSSDNGTLPLDIKPNAGLKAINYELPVASAQVKSTILFAGLHADGITTVIETIPTRDHTRRLLGLKIEKSIDSKTIHYSSRENYPEPKECFVTGDISSAMFFIVLALLTENSEVVFRNVCLNPTRTAAINLLKSMGANIQTEQKDESNNETYGDLIVKTSKLSNVNIKPEMIPLIIDEIPALAVAGLFAEGEFELRNAVELKVKESDRIKSLCYNFSQLGLNLEEFNDGFRISGQIKKKNPTFKSINDHRIAMAFAVLSCVLEDGGSVDGFEFASVSNPDFLNQLKQISG
jgi:3-phosphoshikimate 1-carboxyvinyltransferase